MKTWKYALLNMYTIATQREKKNKDLWSFNINFTSIQTGLTHRSYALHSFNIYLQIQSVNKRITPPDIKLNVPNNSRVVNLTATPWIPLVMPSSNSVIYILSWIFLLLKRIQRILHGGHTLTHHFVIIFYTNFLIAKQRCLLPIWKT